MVTMRRTVIPSPKGLPNPPKLSGDCLVGAAVRFNIARTMRRALATLVPVLLLGLIVAAAYAAVVTYSGGTSQSGKSFTLTVSSDGARFRIQWSADCGDGGKPFQAETASQRALPVRAGRFASHENYDATASDGAKVHYDIAIAGTVRRRSASGTWQAIASGPYKDGGTYKCDTGRVTWKAQRG
jgi:hypothetical protein